MNAEAEKCGKPWTCSSMNPMNKKTVFFDIFEPLLIRDALEAPGHLKELVFGDVWWKRHFPGFESTESIMAIWATYQGGPGRVWLDLSANPYRRHFRYTVWAVPAAKG